MQTERGRKALSDGAAVSCFFESTPELWRVSSGQEGFSLCSVWILLHMTLLLSWIGRGSASMWKHTSKLSQLEQNFSELRMKWEAGRQQLYE